MLRCHWCESVRLSLHCTEVYVHLDQILHTAMSKEDQHEESFSQHRILHETFTISAHPLC